MYVSHLLLSIDPSVGTWIASTFLLFWIILLWTWVYRDLFKTLLSILLGIYPEVELLYHMAMLSLIFWETTILFSAVAVPFYVPTNGTQEFRFLLILTSTCFCFLYISLMTWDVEHLFMCLLAIYISSLEKCLFKSFVYIFIRLFVFLLLSFRSSMYSGY